MRLRAIIILLLLLVGCNAEPTLYTLTTSTGKVFENVEYVVSKSGFTCTTFRLSDGRLLTVQKYSSMVEK